MKCCFITENAKEYPVKRMCQVLGVDESSYDKWRKRLPCPHQVQDEVLAEHIQQGYESNQRVYASPRIHSE